MPVTAYCKKCGQDVPVGDTCPLCGKKLTKASLRTAWCIRYRPAADWISWNTAARVILPAALALLIIVLALEGISGGMAAVEKMITAGLFSTVLMLVGLVALILLIILKLQGESILDCVLDSKGVHVQEYLPDPTPLKLLMRFRSPALMNSVDWDCEEPMVLVSQREIVWRDIARVQLWPEKQLILLYAPAWWMRLTVYATPMTWDGALEFINVKIGKKKNVILPRDLTEQIYMPAPEETAYEEPVTEQQSIFDDGAFGEAQIPVENAENDHQMQAEENQKTE